MGKIFKISGNFEQNEEWTEPGFIGEIAVDDNNRFFGYCAELYPCPKEGQERFLYGAFLDDTQNEHGIIFLKLSNWKRQPVLLYTIRDLETQKDGEWKILDRWGEIANINRQGAAVVSIQEVEYDEARYKDIISRFNRIDPKCRNNFFHMSFLNKILELTPQNSQ